MGTEKRARQKANRQARLAELEKQQQRDRWKRRAIRWGLIGAAFIAGALLLSYLFGRDGGDEEVSADTSVPTETSVVGETTIVPFTYGTGECPPAEPPTEPVKEFADAPQECIDPAKTYTATFDTSEGQVVVELDAATVPGTVNNFVALSRWGYYDGTKVFRTDPSIDIVQGGGESNADDPGYTIPDEGTGFTYSEGDLVMARTAAPDSAGAQFFFSTGPNTSLLDAQGTYVVFGKVSEGLDVLKAIMALHEPGGELGGAPSRDVIVEKVTITES